MVDLRVPAFGDRYRFALNEWPGRHVLLEAALRRWARPGWRIEVTVGSSVPPGSGLGTSASVAVALIAALAALADEVLDAATLARCAHELEASDLGLQSGLQDQIAAAYGGSNLITIDSYPKVGVEALRLEPVTWDALARRVLTVYLGSPHRSSAVHEAVIARLGSANRDTLFLPLRTAATDAATALVCGDLDAYGQAMISNTAAQTALHPSLVGPKAQEVIEVARRHGAAGWKVNGAGGEGGTVTIVGPDDQVPLVRALSAVPGLIVLPLRPARKGAHIVDQA
jgi:D-glycero-alpha-D-manno-heptose-7-phosphate kinase